MTATIPQAIADATYDRIFPEGHRYEDDPVGYLHEALDEETWSKQDEILRSVWSNRYTAVPSAHETGKSHIASRAAVTWLETKPIGDAFVVSTAPTQTQVEAILWRYIEQAHTKHGLRGRITYGQNPAWKIGNEIIGYGRKPTNFSDPNKAMQSFQGIHATHVLIILDEACGIPKWLWDAVDTLAGNDNARVLAIGNPDDPTSQFSKICLPGQGWNVIPISAFDTPVFTGEKVSQRLLDNLVGKRWVEERAQRWGVKSSLYISKVLGQFPDVAENVLIPPALIRQCQQLEITPDRKSPGQLGVDVAREGDDESAIYMNLGGRIRRYKTWPHNTVSELSGFVVKTLRQYRKRIAVVDHVGVGGGVLDNVRETGLPAVGFGASERAREPKRFRDRKAEVWWGFKEQCEEGMIDLPPDGEDDALIAQLQNVRWFLDSAGRIYIESKKDMKKRGLPSPDRADACVMASIPPATMVIPEGDPDKDTSGITDDLLEKKW